MWFSLVRTVTRIIQIIDPHLKNTIFLFLFSEQRWGKGIFYNYLIAILQTEKKTIIPSYIFNFIFVNS